MIEIPLESLLAPTGRPVAHGGVPLRTVAARDAALDPKLVKAAHQFEASLMQELLKPMNAGPLFGDDDDSSSGGGAGGGLTSSSEGSGGALMSFGSEALARALSDKGGLGIARRVLDHFETIAAAAGPDAGGGVAIRESKPLLK